VESSERAAFLEHLQRRDLAHEQAAVRAAALVTHSGENDGQCVAGVDGTTAVVDISST
jgi:hypothetical protein